MTETLTDEERARLARMCQTPLGRKALRIIDANAADRAALVAQLEAAERALASNLPATYWNGRASARADALVSQLAELTRERDEARKKARDLDLVLDTRDAEVTRLTRERDEARDELAAAEHAHAETCSTLPALLAAEARVRELEAALAAAEDRARMYLEHYNQIAEAAQKLATQAQRDHRLAAEWKATAEAYRVDAEVARDRLAALQKRTEAEQRVLGAMADVGYTDLELLRDRQGESCGLKRAAEAELARREALRG